MVTLVTKITERGQASIPAAVRKQLGIGPGTRLLWEPISAHEVRVRVQMQAEGQGPRSVLGYARSFRAARPTSAWMKELREAEHG